MTTLLKALAKASGRSVETADGPGGGGVVRLVDPLGVAVNVHHGFAAVAPERFARPFPTMLRTRRFALTIRKRPERIAAMAAFTSRSGKR